MNQEISGSCGTGDALRLDHAEARASRTKLLTLAEREGVKLIVFGHDAAQWPTLRQSSEFYT